MSTLNLNSSLISISPQESEEKYGDFASSFVLFFVSDKWRTNGEAAVKKKLHIMHFGLYCNIDRE